MLSSCMSGLERPLALTGIANSPEALEPTRACKFLTSTDVQSRCVPHSSHMLLEYTSLSPPGGFIFSGSVPPLAMKNPRGCLMPQPMQQNQVPTTVPSTPSAASASWPASPLLVDLPTLVEAPTFATPIQPNSINGTATSPAELSNGQAVHTPAVSVNFQRNISSPPPPPPPPPPNPRSASPPPPPSTTPKSTSCLSTSTPSTAPGSKERLIPSPTADAAAAAQAFTAPTTPATTCPTDQ